jgi:DNA-directed RNA polymerase subunit H (RpoH/RPB5)
MTDIEQKNYFNPQVSESEYTEIIINNVLIMLHNRLYFTSTGEPVHLIESPDRKKLEEKGLFIDKTNFTYIVKTTNDLSYVFKIVYQKITAIGKLSVISDFLAEYTKFKKIIIASDYNTKIIDYVAKNQTQIFKISAFATNLIDHKDQPQFILMSQKKMNVVKKEYNINQYTTKKFIRGDPIVKYYGLKKGDIVKIKRPSTTSGYGIDYRIVS